MHKRHFERLKTVLLDRGVSPRYANRLVAELSDHYLDIAAERRAAGDTPQRASRYARRALGCDAAIVSQVLARTELRGRYAGLRAALRGWSLAFMPAGPASWASAIATPAVARWSMSITFGSFLTVALLFALARTVALGA